MKDDAEQSIPSRGSQPFAWAADIPGKFGAAPTVLFGYTEKLVRSIAAAGGDVVRPFPLYRQPTLTDAERHAIAVVRNCAMTRAERFLTQSDAEREATLVLWRLRERLG
jgi:hypothetical protein